MQGITRGMEIRMYDFNIQKRGAELNEKLTEELQLHQHLAKYHVKF